MASSKNIRPPRVLLDIVRPRDHRASGGNIFAAPWLALMTTALASAMAAIALAWAITAVPLLIAWSTSPSTNAITAISFATDFWLGAHGVPYEIVGLPVTLVPTGLTVIVVAILGLGTAIAAKQALENELSPRRELIYLASAGAVGGFYVAMVLLILAIVGFSGSPIRSTLGILATGLFSAGLGAWFGLGKPMPPGKWFGIVKGVLVAHLMILMGAGIVLVVGTFLQGDRIASLEKGLGIEGFASFLLGIIYLAFLPTILAWAGAYILGGGFALGLDSFLAPGSSHSGVLPSIPLFGVVTDSTNPNTWAWISVAVIAAIGSAWISVRNLSSVSVLRCAFWGALTNTLAIGSYAVIAFISRGDLGLQRMVGFGPRMFELLIIPTPMFLLLGALVGAVMAFRRRAKASTPMVISEEEATDELWVIDEDTQTIYQRASDDLAAEEKTEELNL